MRGFQLVFSVLVLVAGCGNERLVYVSAVYPYDAGSPPEIIANDGGGFQVNGWRSTVDTESGYCYCEEGKSCGFEPLYDHSALVVVRNDFPADPNNPKAGRITITGYQLSFAPMAKIDGKKDDALRLRSSQGGLKLSVEPESEAYLTVPLASHLLKADFYEIGLTTPLQYQVSFVLTGPNELKLNAFTTVEFGSFVNCPENCAYYGEATCNGLAE